MSRLLFVFLLLLGLPSSGGCAAGKLIGGMLQNEEYQKKIEVLPEYTGLENQRIAVVVQADLATLYEHPHVITNIAGGVAGRIQERVPGAQVIDPRHVVEWQLRSSFWESLPYGEIAERLNVDRVVHVDLYEYRLNPPGNRWLWEGVCLATIGIIERDGIDPDMFADTFTVESRFPTIKGVTPQDATMTQVQTGLLADFIKKASWLFYTHVEPKYPDKYRPELDRDPIA